MSFHSLSGQWILPCSDLDLKQPMCNGQTAAPVRRFHFETDGLSILATYSETIQRHTNKDMSGGNRFPSGKPFVRLPAISEKNPSGGFTIYPELTGALGRQTI